MAEPTITIATSSDSLTITGTGVYEGCTYDRIDRWDGISSTDLAKTKRPMRPGDYTPLFSTQAGRTFAVEGGQFFGATLEEAWAMRERLVALYDDGKPVRVTVADPLRTTSRECFVQEVDVPWTARPFLKFTIDFYAPDARRYGDRVPYATPLAAPGSGLALPWDEGTGVGLLLPSDEALGLGLDLGTIGVDGRVTIPNDGKAEAGIDYEVSGGSMPDGFELVNVKTGQRIVYAGDVAADTTVTVETESEAAFVNGVAPASRFLTTAEWWSTPPGQSTIVQFLARGPVAGTPTLTAYAAPAYY